MKKILVAMSGGVDSSVSAALLKDKGYEVAGATMCLGVSSGIGPKKCCGPKEIDDARRVCTTLGIRHYVFDFSGDMEALVIANFLSEYSRGRTPNPGFSGTETISYTTPGSCDTATLTIRVAACAIAIEPASQSFTAAGGAGSITVTAANSICPWTAVSDSGGWISIISGTSGADSGTVSYTVTANTGAERTGTITVAGKAFTVSQEAAATTNNDCTLTIAPDTVAVRLAGKDSTDNGTLLGLFRYGGPLRIFFIHGDEGTVFKRADRPQWDADTIKTLVSFRLRVNAIAALVFINPFRSEAGEYGLTVGDCTGKITVEDF